MLTFTSASNPFHILVLGETDQDLTFPCQIIRSENVSCATGTGTEHLVNGYQGPMPHAALLDLSSMDNHRARELVAGCRVLGLPVLATVHARSLATYDPSFEPDDLVVQPLHPGELQLRIKQAILKVKGSLDQNTVRAGELTIDLEKYEATVAGQRVLLTYKEYQLLVLLTSHPDKVYTRENLLSLLWGYDYFGGTRTVDVHIRRLRAKTEEAGHSFIETIRNAGYRFRPSS